MLVADSSCTTMTHNKLNILDKIVILVLTVCLYTLESSFLEKRD